MRTSKKISQKEANNNAKIDWFWAGQIVDNYAKICSFTDPLHEAILIVQKTRLNCDIVMSGTLTTINVVVPLARLYNKV